MNISRRKLGGLLGGGFLATIFAGGCQPPKIEEEDCGCDGKQSKCECDVCDCDSCEVEVGGLWNPDVGGSCGLWQPQPLIEDEWNTVVGRYDEGGFYVTTNWSKDDGLKWNDGWKNKYANDLAIDTDFLKMLVKNAWDHTIVVIYDEHSDSKTISKRLISSMKTFSNKTDSSKLEKLIVPFWHNEEAGIDDLGVEVVRSIGIEQANEYFHGLMDAYDEELPKGKPQVVIGVTSKGPILGVI